MGQTIKYKSYLETKPPLVLPRGLGLYLNHDYWLSPQHRLLGPYCLKTNINLFFPKGYHGVIHLSTAVHRALRLIAGTEIISSGDSVCLCIENTDRHDDIHMTTEEVYFYVTLEPDADYKLTKIK